MKHWQCLAIVAVLTVSLAMACTQAPSPGTTSVQPDRVSGPKRVAAAMNGNAYSVYAKLVSGAGGLAAGGQISGSAVLSQLVGYGLSALDTHGALRPLFAEDAEPRERPVEAAS